MIYAIGDSFTEGGELPGQEGFGLHRSPYAWPSVLAKKLNQDIINLGRGACGNTRIVKRTIDTLYKDATGIIICWTSPNRIEMVDDAGVYDIWPARNLWWMTNNPNKQHRLKLLEYITTYHSSDVNLLHDYKNFIRQVILIQNLCQNNNVKCSMFIAFGARENAEQFRDDPAVQNLLKCIDLSMFVDNTLETSTVDWTFPIPSMPGGHPSIKGQEIIADKVFQDIMKKWY